jgi:hypothetical protein
MNLLRIRPARYCPVCGGTARRTNDPTIPPDPKLMSLAASGEVPVWLGLLVGAAIGSVFGSFAGIVAGVIVGAAVAAALIRSIFSLEQRRLVYECSNCKRRFPLSEFLWRKPNDLHTPS